MTNVEELQIQSETYYQEVLSIGRYYFLHFRVEYLTFIDIYFIDILILSQYLMADMHLKTILISKGDNVFQC